LEKILKELDDWMGASEEEEITVIGGDFNVRTAEEGGGVMLEEEGEGRRNRRSRRR